MKLVSFIFFKEISNMFRKTALVSALLVAGTIGSVATLPSAAATAVIQLDTAPPEVRVERAPVVRRGYVYSPGYWDYRNNRHVWVRGTVVRERRGYVYAPGRWEERDGHWVLERRHWSRENS
jgi:hypothetical protein